MVPTQGGSVLYVCTKFEVDSSFHSIVIRGPKFRPASDPLDGGTGRPKFNQLEMVTTFTYKPSLVRIDARNLELSCNRPTNTQTNPQTGPITIHCAAKLSTQCNQKLFSEVKLLTSFIFATKLLMLILSLDGVTESASHWK